MTELTYMRLRELLSYDPETGEFRWRVRTINRIPAGTLAGTINNQGYAQVSIDGRLYKRSRLVWLHVHGRWPASTIDHVNRRRDDDRLGNLREASYAQNNANRKSKGRFGIKGVYLNKRGKFVAEIRFEGKKLHLGTWHTAEEAGGAYRHFERLAYGGYAYAARAQ